MSISAARAAYKAARATATTATVPTVCSMRRVNSRSEIKKSNCPAKILRGEFADQAIDRSELVGRGEKYDAQVPVGGRRAESRAVDAQHARRAKECEHVLLVGAPWRKRNARHGVKS